MKVLIKRIVVILIPLALLIVTAYAEIAYATSFETISFIPFKIIAVERDVTYKVVDDISLKMDIYYPVKRAGKLPAVVYIHGGGWYSGDKTGGAGQDDIPELVDRGYIVASVNYRLAPEYKFPAQIEDIKCAIRFLRENAAVYGIDTAHIGAFGDSAGGHLASLLGVTDAAAGFQGLGWYDEQSDKVQAVVNMFGPADLTLNFQKDRSLLIEHVFGTIDENSSIIRQASPISYVSFDDPPFLIIHGDKDNEICPCQSEILYQKLVSAGIPASLMIVSNCSHSFLPVGEAINPSRDEITDTMGDFFDRFLQ